MPVKFIRVKKANLPRFVFTRKQWKGLGDVVGEGVADNIRRSKQADGSPIQENKPGTILQKRNKGSTFRGRIRPLIDEKHRAIQSKERSWRTLASTRNAKIIGTTLWLLDKMIEWQQRGYTGWMGISKVTRRVLRAELKLIIRQLIRKANPRG